MSETLGSYMNLNNSLKPQALEKIMVTLKDDSTALVNETASFQASFKVQPPVITPANVLSIRLPVFETGYMKPQPLKVTMASQSAAAVAYTAEQKTLVDLTGLDDIDISKISEGKSTKESSVYSMAELKQIAKRLGIPAPTIKKDLAEAIIAKLNSLGKTQ